MGIGIVGILDVPGTDLLLVPEDCLSILHGILFVEDTVEKEPVFFLSLYTDKYPVYQAAQNLETLMDGHAAGTVFGLLPVLANVGLNLLPKGRIKTADAVPGPHLKGAQDDAVAGEPGDVAADELAVHADGPALDLENPDLLSRYVLEAGVHQVYSMPFLVIDNTTAETIIGVKAWNLLRKAHNTEGPARQQVILAFLEELLVTAAETFLQHGHGCKFPNGCRRGTHYSALEQWTEVLLIYLARHKLEKLVVPCLGIVVMVRGTLAHQV